jgi:diadenosine tetraphosphate (Ap4A) HIT family hydrolase
MTKCQYCEIIELKHNVLYEDKEVIVAVKETVLQPGQVTIFSKEHFTILEMVPEKVLKACAVMSNKVGVAVFDSLQAQGTNILVMNGLGAGQTVPHFAIDVIPRQPDDKINLEWTPKQLMEDEMEMTTSLLIKELEKLGKEPEKVAKGVEIVEDHKDNPLLKSLRRIP